MQEQGYKLSRKEKLAYGGGQLPGAFFMAFFGQIQIFYVFWMRLSLEYMILGQVIYMIWNVVNDPIFGVLMDRTRRKDGRYIPWVKIFSPIYTISFIMLFLVPSGWRYTATEQSTQLLLFLWYMSTLLLYDTGFTVVYLAYAALLPQVSHDFKERTEMAIYATIFGAVGGVVSEIFPLIFLTNPTAEKIEAFQWCTVIFGAVSMLAWVFMVTFVKERGELIPEKKESFWRNIKHVFKNPACRVYIIYDGLTVGINTALMSLITIIFAWAFGLDNPYAASPTDITGFILYFIPVAIGVVIGVILQFYVPNRWDLKTLLLLDYALMFTGFFIAFLGGLPAPGAPYDTYSLPWNVWVVSVGVGIGLPGILGSLIYLNPLNADVVDYDEILTGARRESVYSGVNCIFSKPMVSIVAIVVPAILLAFGLAPVDPLKPLEAFNVLHGFPSAITGVAVASFLFPAILSLIGFFCFLPYPLGRKKLAEIRAILDAKHAKEKAAFDEKFGSSDASTRP
ncbi:MAG: MFS transporter [Candidatus Sigynarchaeota archaeon]